MVDTTRRSLIKNLITEILICYDELRGKDNISFSMVAELGDTDFGEVRMVGYRGGKQMLRERCLFVKAEGDSEWRPVIELDAAEELMVAGFIGGACVNEVIDNCRGCFPGKAEDLMGICRKLVGQLMKNRVLYPDSPLLANEYWNRRR